MFGTSVKKKIPKVMLLTLAFILTLGLVMTGCPSPSVGTEVGNKAPDFQLQDLNGRTVSLSDQRGLPVIINFWATRCGYCVNEMPYLQAVHDEWHSQGLTLLAINIGESSGTAVDFMEYNHFSFTVLLDTWGNVATQYVIPGIPTTFFIDKDGIIQDKVFGPFYSQAEIESRLSQIMP